MGLQGRGGIGRFTLYIYPWVDIPITGNIIWQLFQFHPYYVSLSLYLWRDENDFTCEGAITKAKGGVDYTAESSTHSLSVGATRVFHFCTVVCRLYSMCTYIVHICTSYHYSSCHLSWILIQQNSLVTAVSQFLVLLFGLNLFLLLSIIFSAAYMSRERFTDYSETEPSRSSLTPCLLISIQLLSLDFFPCYSSHVL